ncbi:MAG: RNA methyltransferase [Bacteroidales bacterium]|jgi:tRNA G18 (ribose-2'-O)-methylase SpoU|nr:RNA methyltransferase [Bacteroidales bacterium]
MRKLQNEELGRITPEQFKRSEKSPFVIVLDNIRSQSNVGSVFRTADAFLTESIYICGITAVPPHREIQKTALGATESVAWKYFKETIEAVRELKSRGYKIVGIEQVEGSVSLGDFEVKEGIRYALVFGHEVNGVDQAVLDTCDHVVEIPQFGTKHSFNIAVSAGIVLWEMNKKSMYSPPNPFSTS